MARPLRIEFPGAVYHVASRGARQASLFADEEDYRQFLAVVEQGLKRFDAQMLAYCLVNDYYEFVVFTRAGNLSRLMRHINGVYTQTFNRRYEKKGHLMQGRFRAVVVDREAHLLDVCRMVEYLPVRLGYAKAPASWAWSSYSAHVGNVETPDWLETQGLLNHVLGREVTTPGQRQRAQEKYAELVKNSSNINVLETNLVQQVFLGDEEFAARMMTQAHAVSTPKETSSSGSTKNTNAKNSSKILSHWLRPELSREEGLRQAYVEGGMTMTSIAAALELTVARVSQLVAKAEAALYPQAAIVQSKAKAAQKQQKQQQLRRGKSAAKSKA
jgi:REP element-mobilizing transposase RayT